MRGRNAQWYTPRRKRKLFANGVAVGFFTGGIIGGALVLVLQTI